MARVFYSLRFSSNQYSGEWFYRLPTNLPFPPPIGTEIFFSYEEEAEDENDKQDSFHLHVTSYEHFIETWGRKNGCDDLREYGDFYIALTEDSGHDPEFENPQLLAKFLEKLGWESYRDF